MARPTKDSERISKINAPPKSPRLRSIKSSAITLKKGEVRIKYSDSYDLLDKLLGLTKSVSHLHVHKLLATKSGLNIKGDPVAYLSGADIPDVLGPERAYSIVTGCAGETDLTKKLGDVPGLDLAIFQSCVQSGVIAAGYKPGNIPASSSTTLWEVVQAIQGCPS